MGEGGCEEEGGGGEEERCEGDNIGVEGNGLSQSKRDGEGEKQCLLLS